MPRSFSDSHAGAGASGPRGLGPAQLSWRGRRGCARLCAGCPGDYGDRHLDGVRVRGSGLVRFSMIYYDLKGGRGGCGIVLGMD